MFRVSFARTAPRTGRVAVSSGGERRRTRVEIKLVFTPKTGPADGWVLWDDHMEEGEDRPIRWSRYSPEQIAFALRRAEGGRALHSWPNSGCPMTHYAPLSACFPCIRRASNEPARCGPVLGWCAPLDLHGLRQPASRQSAFRARGGPRLRP